LRTRGSCSRPCRAARTASQISSHAAARSTLQHKVQIEPELQLADDDDGRLIAAECHDVTAANLTFDLKSQLLEKTLYRAVQRRFQDPLLLVRWLPTLPQSTSAGLIGILGLADTEPLRASPWLARIMSGLARRSVGLKLGPHRLLQKVAMMPESDAELSMNRSGPGKCGTRDCS
jgi:hypothetical protein